MGFLSHSDSSIPASIFLKVFGDGITIIDNSNRFEFIKFEEKSEIEFFKSQDWIVDFDDVKNLDDVQFIELGQSIAKQKNDIAIKYNAMSNEERVDNQYLFFECERLDFKMYSLRDILWLKQGHIHFDLPSGIHFPDSSMKVKEKLSRRLLRKLKR